jgi:hypothetical protein
MAKQDTMGRAKESSDMGHDRQMQVIDEDEVWPPNYGNGNVSGHES